MYMISVSGMSWLNGGEATRTKFIEALKNMDHIQIAQEIESQYGNSKNLCLHV